MTMKLTLEDAIAITKPHNDKLIAEGRAEKLERVNAELLTALNASAGYLLNAKIDLQTGAPKQTAINTIDGGLKVVRAAITKAEGLAS